VRLEDELRTVDDAVRLWARVRATRDARQSWRLRTLAKIYEGASGTEAPRLSGVGQRRVLGRVLRSMP
jgi:hypothetical protein